MDEPTVMVGTLLEDVCLTLEQLCSAGGVAPEWVIVRIREGLLQPPGDRPSLWRFGSRDLWRVRQMQRLEISFGAEPELAALVVDLREEIARLRAQLQRPV